MRGSMILLLEVFISFLPTEDEAPLKYSRHTNAIKQMPLKEQFSMTMSGEDTFKSRVETHGAIVPNHTAGCERTFLTGLISCTLLSLNCLQVLNPFRQTFFGAKQWQRISINYQNAAIFCIYITMSCIRCNATI